MYVSSVGKSATLVRSTEQRSVVASRGLHAVPPRDWRHGIFTLHARCLSRYLIILPLSRCLYFSSALVFPDNQYYRQKKNRKTPHCLSIDLWVISFSSLSDWKMMLQIRALASSTKSVHHKRLSLSIGTFYWNEAVQSKLRRNYDVPKSKFSKNLVLFYWYFRQISWATGWGDSRCIISATTRNRCLCNIRSK